MKRYSKYAYILFLLFHFQSPGLNIITEYIMGVILPGEPIANVCFKTYGYISMSQAVSFLSDFKLGHYMKIPPRSMFIVQVYMFCYTYRFLVRKIKIVLREYTHLIQRFY